MIVFGFRLQRLLHGLRVALIGIQWLTWDRPGKNVSSMGSPLRAEPGLQVDFGENYVQELLEKASALPYHVRPTFYLGYD